MLRRKYFNCFKQTLNWIKHTYVNVCGNKSADFIDLDRRPAILQLLKSTKAWRISRQVLLMWCDILPYSWHGMSVLGRAGPDERRQT